MAFGFENPAEKRKSLLSVIMLAVLAASVVAAWLVIAPSSKLTKAGTEVLEDIRSKGLGKFWGKQEVDIWMLGYSREGELLGWRNFTRRPFPGGYEGTQLRASRQVELVRENWKVSEDGSFSSYEGASRTVTGRSTTLIQLKEGKVTVSKPAISSRTFSSPAPENYIPEGLNHLAYELALRVGKPARFCIVFNATATRGSGVNFTPVLLSTEGPDSVALTSAQSGGKMVFSFDGDGFIASIEETVSGVVYNRATAQQVLTHFPEARLFRPDLRPGRTPTTREET